MEDLYQLFDGAQRVLRVGKPLWECIQNHISQSFGSLDFCNIFIRLQDHLSKYRSIYRSIIGPITSGEVCVNNTGCVGVISVCKWSSCVTLRRPFASIDRWIIQLKWLTWHVSLAVRTRSENNWERDRGQPVCVCQPQTTKRVTAKESILDSSSEYPCGISNQIRMQGFDVTSGLLILFKQPY